jgi:hypothetical protein
MDSALRVVQDMEFVGFSSKKFTGRNEEDMRNNIFCTMPIKFRFEDRNARIHFETAMHNHCTLKASISLPKPIREEQSAFLKALRCKYAGQVVTVRPDTTNMALQGFIKPEGKKWERLPDRVILDYVILLPGYKVRTTFDLAPAVQVQEPVLENAGACGGQENMQS